MRAQVVLLDEGLILLARHERGNHPYWVLPGGAVEEGETAAEAAVREVREETGLEIRVTRLLFVDGPRIEPPVVIRQPRHTFLGEIVGGDLHPVVEPDGGTEAKGHLVGSAWMPLDSPEFDEATRDTLRLVREALFDGA